MASDVGHICGIYGPFFLYPHVDALMFLFVGGVGGFTITNIGLTEKNRNMAEGAPEEIIKKDTRETIGFTG